MKLEERFRKNDFRVQPRAPTPGGGDYWEKDAKKWIRVHVRPRTALCTPYLVQGGPVAAGCTLLPTRTTEVKYEGDGDDHEVIEDDWDGEDPVRILDRRWTGRTIFHEDDVQEHAATPARDDVCYTLLEETGYAAVPPQADTPDWVRSTLSYRVPVPKAGRSAKEQAHERRQVEQCRLYLDTMVFGMARQAVSAAASGSDSGQDAGARRLEGFLPDGVGGFLPPAAPAARPESESHQRRDTVDAVREEKVVAPPLH